MIIDTPGELRDVSEELRKKWSDKMSKRIDDEIDYYNLTQFFNPTKKPLSGDAVEKKIEWNAFPKEITLAAGGSDKIRWEYADRNRITNQNEYCEWHVDYDNSGKVTKIEFTSEGPEYWEFLADEAPDKLVELYQEYVSPSVKKEDLYYASGSYDPNNKWNDPSKGGRLAHLGNRNNTLFAFINIGCRATIIRKRSDGSLMTGEQELIECGLYGGPNRHSDPHIGGEVNALARLHSQISMANPVGLSMEGLFPSGWITPDGTDPKTFWKVLRGTEKHQMRTVLEVPSHLGYTVGDIKIGTKNIEYGGQVADFVRVKLVGVAHEFGKHETPSRPCPGTTSDSISPEEEDSHQKEMAAFKDLQRPVRF